MLLTASVLIGMALLDTSTKNQEQKGYEAPPKVTFLQRQSQDQIEEWKKFSEEVFGRPLDLGGVSIPQTAKTVVEYNRLAIDAWSWDEVLAAYKRQGIAITTGDTTFHPDMLIDHERPAISVFWIVSVSEATDARDDSWHYQRLSPWTVKNWMILNLFFRWKKEPPLDKESYTMCGASLFRSPSVAAKCHSVGLNKVQVLIGPGNLLPGTVIRQGVHEVYGPQVAER